MSGGPATGTSGEAPPDVPRLVDGLFRHERGRILATLVRALGAENFDLAEEVVQEAMLRALLQWPYHGVPAHPDAWLLRTAKNRAIDALRRRSLHDRKANDLARELYHGETALPAAGYPREIDDDQLRMIFLCCHPVLPRPARVALTLSVVAGFGPGEISRALLAAPAAVAQRIVRAKRALRANGVGFEMPAGEALLSRLDAVLDVLYLVFNEGYTAHDGEALLRPDLCREAIRLASLVAAHPLTDLPRVHALLALMLLHAARLPTRTDAAGDLLLLSEQDRTRWDRALIGAGMAHLARSAAGDELTAFHVEAAIAACHAAAPSFEATDWPRILGLYDQLLRLRRSPVVALNRAVAVAMVHGAETGLAAAAATRVHRALRFYALLPATLAELYRRSGEADRAAEQLRRALALPCTAAERRFLQRRLAELAAPAEP